MMEKEGLEVETWREQVSPGAYESWSGYPSMNSGVMLPLLHGASAMALPPVKPG